MNNTPSEANCTKPNEIIHYLLKLDDTNEQSQNGNEQIQCVVGGNTDDLPLVGRVQFESITLSHNYQSEHMYSRCLSAILLFY